MSLVECGNSDEEQGNYADEEEGSYGNDSVSLEDADDYMDEAQCKKGLLGGDCEAGSGDCRQSLRGDSHSTHDLTLSLRAEDEYEEEDRPSRKAAPIIIPGKKMEDEPSAEQIKSINEELKSRKLQLYIMTSCCIFWFLIAGVVFAFLFVNNEESASAGGASPLPQRDSIGTTFPPSSLSTPAPSPLYTMEDSFRTFRPTILIETEAPAPHQDEVSTPTAGGEADSTSSPSTPTAAPSTPVDTGSQPVTTAPTIQEPSTSTPVPNGGPTTPPLLATSSPTTKASTPNSKNHQDEVTAAPSAPLEQPLTEAPMIQEPSSSTPIPNAPTAAPLATTSSPTTKASTSKSTPEDEETAAPRTTKPTEALTPTSQPLQTASPTSKPTEAFTPTSQPPLQTISPTSKPTEALTPTSQPLQTISPTSKPTEALTPTSQPLQTATPTFKVTSKAPEPTAQPLQTASPTPKPTSTQAPTPRPTTLSPTISPTTNTPAPTAQPLQTASPTPKPTTVAPTLSPTTLSPTPSPTTSTPAPMSETPKPTTLAATPTPTTLSPTTTLVSSPTISPTIMSCQQDPCGALAECWELVGGGLLCECPDETEVGFHEDCQIEDSVTCPQRSRVYYFELGECLCPPETPNEDKWGFCFASTSMCLDEPCVGVGSTCHDDGAGYICKCSDDSVVSDEENCDFSTIKSCDEPFPCGKEAYCYEIEKRGRIVGLGCECDDLREVDFGESCEVNV